MEESDLNFLHSAETMEGFYAGEGTPVDNLSAKARARVLADARQARSEHYSYWVGPMVMEPLSVESAVKAQSSMTGEDLNGLYRYADYVRNEFDAAKKARPDAVFSGTWGTDKATNDVDEYVGWLMQAAQLELRARKPMPTDDVAMIEIPPVAHERLITTGANAEPTSEAMSAPDKSVIRETAPMGPTLSELRDQIIAMCAQTTPASGQMDAIRLLTAEDITVA